MLRKILHYLLVLFLLISCSKDDNTNSTDKKEQGQPKTLVKEESEIIEVNENSLILSGDTNINIQDIVVSGANNNAPNGFLRKVVEVTNEGGNSVVRTQQATLDEAIEHYFKEGETYKTSFEYTFQQNNASGKGNGVGKSSVTPIKQTINETYTTIQNGVPIKITLTGEIEIIPKIICDIDVAVKDLKPIYNEFRLAFTAETNLDVNVETELSVGFDTNDIKLGSFEGPPITVQIGPLPVVFRPQFVLYIGANGNVTANFLYTYTNNSTTVAGVKYKNGWQFLSDNGFNVNSQDSSFSAEVNGELKAYIKPVLSIGLYDNSIASGGVTISPYARFDGSINLTRFSWMVNGGIETSAFFKANAFGANLVDKEWNNLIDIPEWEISSGFSTTANIGNLIPEDFSTISEQPITFSWQANEFNQDLTFEVLLGDSEANLSSIGKTSENILTHENILPSGNYVWKVVATLSDSNDIVESLIQGFTITENNSISPANLPNPEDGATEAILNGNLSFNPGENTPSDARFFVFLSQDPNPNTVLNSGINQTNFEYTNLEPNTTYHWKVETSNETEVLATSEVWSFTTAPSQGNTNREDVFSRIDQIYSFDFSNDGQHFYYSGQETVYHYALSTPFNLSTATYIEERVIPSSGISVQISDNGDRFYIHYRNRSGDVFKEYSINIPFQISDMEDVSTRGHNFDIRRHSQLTENSKSFVYSHCDYFSNIVEFLYKLNVDETALNDSQVSQSINSAPICFSSFSFSQDGNQFYGAENTDNILKKYTLSNPFDITTIGVGNEIETVQLRAGERIFFLNNNGVFYTLRNENGKSIIGQYN